MFDLSDIGGPGSTVPPYRPLIDCHFAAIVWQNGRLETR